MQIIRYGQNESDSQFSIQYKKGADVYAVSNFGIEVCILLIGLEDYLKIKANDTQHLIERVNQEFNKSYKNLNFNCYLEDTYNLSGIDKFYVNVTEPVSVNDLPYGVFEIKYMSGQGLVFRKMPDEKVKPKILQNHDLKPHVLDLLENKSTNRKNKKGLLLYGPPGNGKTSNIFQLRDFCTQENRTRMFFVANRVELQELNSVKHFFTEDTNIFVFEELTERISRNGLADILTFLDGENSWNNSICIATSNNPELLPANVVDRPGRFDTFIEYKNPTSDQIDTLAGLFGIDTDENLSSIKGKELSFDYISFIMDKAIKTKQTIKETYQQEVDHRKRLSDTFKGTAGGISMNGRYG